MVGDFFIFNIIIIIRPSLKKIRYRIRNTMNLILRQNYREIYHLCNYAIAILFSQMALSISYFTYIQHIFIWGSILFWYIFLLAYGAIDPSFSTTAYKVFIEALAPAPFFWIITLLILIASLLPYFIYASIQMRFFPMYHQMIQWMRNDRQTSDPEYCNVVRQRSIRHTTVGFTARLEASKRFEASRRVEAFNPFEASKRSQGKSEDR